MEEGTRSGDSSGVVVKNRNSSGCLVIRKKGDGVGTSGGSRQVFVSKKEKKRPRMVASDSGSSDELLEPHRRRVVSRTGGQVGNGYEKGIVEKSEIYRDRNDVEENERKRSKLDVFEFDEYDAMDGKRLKSEFMDDSDDDEDERGSFFGSKSAGGSGIRREFETGGSKGDIVYKRKHSYFDSSSSLMGERNMASDRSMNKRFEMKRDGARVPVLLRDKFGDTSEEPIRLQGRNGVLKVMPNKNKKGSGVLKTYDHLGADDYRKGLRSVDTVKKNELVRPSFYSELKVHEKPGSSDRAKKNKLNLRKSLPTKNSKALDWESEDSDTSLKLGPNKLEGQKSVKIVRSKDEMTPPSANTTLTGSNEGKIKRGSGTEKQKLREQIRKMLLDAGWTIDYRPRKNRDYQDAVYVNPSGTAYWSIIKAYDALQKQFGEEDNNVKPSGECSSFSPISEDVLNKLTRQTRKKIEKEMRKKHRDACGTKNARETALKKSANKHDRKSMGNDRAEEKLSTYLKQGGKSGKGKGNENVFPSSNMDMDMDSHDSTHLSHEANHLSEDNKTGNLSIHGRKSRKLGRCTLVVRSTSKGVNSETDGYIPYTGKRTLLSWLIDTGTVGLSEKVQYMNRRQTRVMQEGWITRDGIHCGCCSKILSVSKFEIHAGSKLRQPFQNIYLESGSSLLQCQIDAWNRQEESERSSFLSVFVDGDDPNDDTCGLCGDGGDLICCDGCPSTFHQNCLGIQMLPLGDWHCPNCTCKFCRMAGGSSAEENDSSGCALLKCDLCEKKYHQSCIQDVDTFRVDSSTPSPSFCGQKCRELFENLQKFLGVKHELEGGFTWSLIHRTDTDSDTSLRGFPQRVECNSKLAVALTVMDECFLPIVDRRSGINLIHNVLYNCGSNFNRLNFSGFYTAILERGDEIISAASIRIHGTQLAEMPFIGTRHIYRHQGMCRRLFYAIESALCSFKVEKMVIPAISELMHTWTEVFGFNYLEESQKKDLRYMNILVFPGIDMLQKLLIEEENNHQDVTTSAGAKPMKLEGKHSSMPEMLNKSDKDSLAENNLPVCGDARVRHVGGTDDKVAYPDSASLGPVVTLNDASVPSTSLDAPHEVKVTVSSEEIICSNGQSGEKLPESAAESKSSFPADASNVVQEKTHEDEPDRTGVKPMELERKHSLMPEMLIKPDKDSLVEHDLHACDDGGLHHVGGTDDNVGASESASQSQGLTFNDASVPSTSIDAPHVVNVSVSSEEVFCSNTQSGEKAPEAATESKSFYPADSSNLVQDMIGSPVDDNLKSSGEDDMDILTVGASDSGSQSRGVTLSDTSVPSTSLDAPDIVKVHVSCEEILCSNAQSGDKVPEAATESKSFYPVDSCNFVQETDDSPILDSPVDCSLKSSAEGDMDVLKVGASASASQSQGVTSNHVSVPSTSLAAPHVLKVPVFSEEIMCLNAQSGEKVPEAATDSLSIFHADCTNLVQEMEDNPTLNSPVDGNFKSSAEGDVDVLKIGASDSAFQSGEVTLNDALPSTSVDAPDVVKLPVSGEIRCSNAQSGGKVPEAASESKSFYPADSSNLVQETEDNLILISPVDGNLKSCAEGDMDVLNVSNVDASVELHSHSFEKVFSQISTRVADENKNDISAPLHGIDESTMEVKSDLDRCNPCEKENKIFESSEVACGATGCNNSIGHASGDCSGTGVWEMKTCSQSGHNLPESDPDSGSHAFEVITRSQSGDNLVESASTSKCLSPSNMNEAASKMENNLAFDTLVGSDTQSSSLSYIDGVDVNNNVACAVPAALSTSPEVSAYNSTEVVSEEKATYVSTSHGSDETTMQLN